MELYVRFISTLAFGLIGLGAVLKVLLETIFDDWDAFNDVAQRVMMTCSGKGGHVAHVRAEDMLLEAEKQNFSYFGTRLVDARRREIRELDDIETHLTNFSGAPVTDSDILPS